MAHVSSSSNNGQPVFDFESQAGITHLLASIRASEISPAQKNELRDLVFLYSNGGHDVTVKSSLEQKIQSYNLQPVERKTSAQQASTTSEQKEVPTIGKFRFAPSFSAPTPTAPATPPPAPQAVPEPPKPAPMPEPAPAPAQSNSVQTPTPEPVQTQPTPAAPVTPPPAPEPVPEPPKAAPMPEPAPAPQPAAVPDMSAMQPDQEAALRRIREIKALVNEKVGNPVNLVDINNEVGREYMSSLLDAMKKINGGASATSAMNRLEAAYASVEETLKNRDTAPTPEPVQAQPTPAAPVTPPPAPQPVSEPPKPAPMPESAPIPEPEPVVAVAQKVELKQEEPKSEAVSSRLPIQDLSDKISTPTPKPISSSNDDARWGGDDSEKKETPPAAPGVKPLSSLADLSSTAAKTAPSPEQAKAEAVKSGDPLYTPEIDQGLEQLLSEWSIFKKSGLFGTGPKGREHPLFKKMAGLQIPLLLAGRFEGATQEIKQSVTDYMNGWRYEQGLIYEQGETFEHYLRRVIKHILDLQKTRM